MACRLGARLPAAALAVTAIAALACAHEARRRGDIEWVGEIGPEQLEGIVRLTGSHPFPFVVVQGDDGQARIVTGALRQDIQRLSGARVRVTGRFVQGALPDTTLEATSYEVISVEGDRPLLGRIESDSAGFYLARGGEVASRLGFVPESLARQVGAIVWVVLDDRGGVGSYGIVREPG